MFKKIIITLVVTCIVAFGYWTISPFFVNKIVEEKLPQSTKSIQNTQSNANNQSEPKKIASGSFVGFDKIHDGKGSVTLYEIDGKKVLRFEEGFMVNNGPDLYVGFGLDGKYMKGSEISKLKGNIGSQNYDVPDGFDIAKYNNVYVWCKAFSVPFIKADLVFVE
jgi:hypothetical protein